MGKKAQNRLCDVPGCEEPGDYPAPKSARDLSDRYHFCLEHVKTYNRSWNGLEGFSPGEIFDLQHGGATWNRPTWKLGVSSESNTAATATYDERLIRDFFKLFTAGQDPQTAGQHAEAPLREKKLPTEVREACAIFAIQVPYTRTELKKTYRDLAKRYHPDHNQGNAEAQEHLKRVNHAYKVLQVYLEKHEKPRRR